MNRYTIQTPVDFVPLCNRLLEQSETTIIIALHGDLGAGKTTFVQQLGHALGVLEMITSPTFTILARYTTTHPQWQTLLHMDAYRLEEMSELKPLQFAALCAEPSTIFCVEWAERIAEALPSTTIHLTFTSLAEETRTAVVQSHDQWLATR